MDEETSASQTGLAPNALRTKHAHATWLPKDMILSVVHAGEEDDRLVRELFTPGATSAEDAGKDATESTAVLLQIRCDPDCIDAGLENAANAATALTRELQSILQTPLPEAAGMNSSVTRHVLLAIGPGAPMSVLAAIETQVDALILLSPVAAELAGRKSEDERLEGFARCFAEAAPLETSARLKCPVLLAWPAGGSQRILQSVDAWRRALEESGVRCNTVISAFSGDRLEADVGTLGALRMEIDRFLENVSKNGSSS